MAELTDERNARGQWVSKGKPVGLHQAEFAIGFLTGANRAVLVVPDG